MFFDPRRAKLLGAGEHLVIDGCQGLRLVATKTKKTWTYRYKAKDGRMKQVAIGQWPEVPVQAVAAKWQALRHSRNTGIDPVAERHAKKLTIQRGTSAIYSVRNLVDDYIEGHLEINRKVAGALADKRRLASVLDADPNFARMTAEAVTRADAFDIIDKVKATPTAAQKIRSLLGASWDYALDSGRLDGNVPNWWRVVMKGRLKSKGKMVDGKHAGPARRLLSAAEVGTLLGWLPNMHSQGRDAVVMYLWTCTRGSEILAIRPEHVAEEPDGWWWTIPKAQTKNASFREAVDLRVPLAGRALEVVLRRLKEVGTSGFLFEDARGEQYEQKDFSTYIYSLQPYSKKVKLRQSEGLVIPVTNWTPHNLRRTGRTLLASLGCNDEIAEAVIGHLPKDIVGTYNAYTYDRERKRWLAKLATYLEASAMVGLPARP